MITCKMKDAVKQLIGQDGMGEFSEKCFQENSYNMDISLDGELNLLSSVHFLNIFLHCCCRSTSPEDSLRLQTVRLLEEVDAGLHDGGDGTGLVVQDPLQGDTKLLTGMPGGEVQVRSGLATAHLGVPTVVVFHLFGDGKHANIHKLGQLRQRFYSLNFPAKLVTYDGFEKVENNPNKSCWMDYE